MIDPATIAVPPTPTATSTAQEWATYMSYVRAMAEFAVAKSAADHATILGQPEAPHPDTIAASDRLAESISALASALTKPAGVPLGDFVEVLKMVLVKP